MDDEEGENGEVVDKTKIRSKIWESFVIVSRKDCLAKCKECNKSLSYRSSTSNLKKHLTRKHGNVMDKLSEDEGEDAVEEITYLEDEEEGEQETEIAIDKRKILRNGAWEYFEVLDEERKIATCTICHKEFSYRTTSTNLARHLKRRHCIEFEKVTDEDFTVDGVSNETCDDDDDGDSDEKDTSTTDKRRSKTSAAWEFFTVKDPERRVATCKLCDSQFSYMSTVSNLMKHIHNRHSVRSKPDELRRYDDDDSDTKPDLRSQHRSSVWLYFKCIDPAAKVSVCLICKKQLSHLTSITNLKKHLYRKHPRVQLDTATNGKKMLISSDGQLYEIDDAAAKREAEPEDHEQSEPLEMNAIYLDDYEGSAPARKRRRAYLDDAALAETLSSDDELTFHKKYVRKKLDSIDQFGKYLASLLKQLPREVSNQLQADFVKQAMSAQLRCDATNAHDAGGDTSGGDYVNEGGS